MSVEVHEALPEDDNVFTVSCDACGEYVSADPPFPKAFPSRAAAELDAYNHRWTLDDDEAYCPACWARLEAEGD